MLRGVAFQLLNLGYSLAIVTDFNVHLNIIINFIKNLKESKNY